MKRNQQGFTLIELMIVVAIIAILAAIAIPLYLNYTAQAEGSEGPALASSLQTDIAAFYSETGHFPANNGSAGAASAKSITGKYVLSVTNAKGLITVLFKPNGVAKPLENANLYLSAYTKGGSIVWTCSVKDASMFKYVPSTCRNSHGG